MTYATATTHSCVAQDNLSTAMDHYGTRNDLCSTIMDILEAYNNLSTAIDLKAIKEAKRPTPMIILARPMDIPYDPATIVRTAAEPAGTPTSLPSD